VILDSKKDYPGLNDSKKLNPQVRYALSQLIRREALCWGIGWASPEEIDEINILQASFLAMHRAIDQLCQKPQQLLIDGNRFNPYQDIPFQCIIGGDALYQSIAAASILAKTHRDELMLQAHADYPQYAWDRNKGYPTTAHKLAIAQHGLCPLHRKSFNHGLQTRLDF
jgi:ribonuclease HII